MHEQLVFRFIELMNTGQIDRFGEVIAASYKQHNPLVEQGLTGIQDGARWFASVFADAHATLEDLVSEGDRVVARITWTGIHEGTFMGVGATHQRVSWTGIDWWRVEDGKLSEHWDVVDWSGLKQQLTEPGLRS